jgi:hypothetical protein
VHLLDQVNITASAITGINDGVGWLATDIGREISMNSGKATITARTNATVAVATVTTAFTNANSYHSLVFKSMVCNNRLS